MGDPSVFGTRFEAEFGKGKEMRVDCERRKRRGDGEVGDADVLRWHGRVVTWSKVADSEAAAIPVPYSVTVTAISKRPHERRGRPKTARYSSIGDVLW